MKFNYKYAIALTMGLAMTAGTLTSCSDDDDDNNGSADNSQNIINEIDAKDVLTYNSTNKDNWNKYMMVVANYLKSDASSLYNDWTENYEGGEAYATTFKNAGKNTTFASALAATEQIVDGCIDIAHEVGQSKIGDPLELWKSKKYEEALYSVESWYSWHSRVDYSNNIESIKNSYYGSLDGKVAATSISAAIAKKNAALDKEVSAAIQKTISTILGIPQPFRNHIASNEALAAVEACAELEELLDKKLKPALSELNEDELEAINAAYVDNVVLPTYKSLKDANEDLYNSVAAFAKAPSNSGFETLCDKWIASRTFWEKSEAFLFGPVGDLGLDPNMDSWPLDQSAIQEILSKGDFSDLNWEGEFDEENEGIAAAQSIRGFHTIEYLIYKSGKPRTIAN